MKRSICLCSCLLFLFLSHGLAAERPNILWLITEDMGPELGCYGTPQVSTPVLDGLAAKGMRFTNAFTVTPVCSTSRSSFCTGNYALTIGAHQHRTRQKQPLPEGVRPITAWLRDAGYYTSNMKGGSLAQPGKTDWNFVFDGKRFDGAKWSELKDHQPFYAQVNHSQSHRGWGAPRHADPAQVELPPYYPDHPVVRDDWAQYLDEVTEVDGLIGKILKRLEADGLADNTMIIMMGDHGRAHVRGKQWPYDSGLRIPLIIYVPPGMPQPKGFLPGTVSDQLIEAIDLTATTLAWAGVPKPKTMEGRVLFGDQADPPREVAFASRDRCDMALFRIRTARDKRYRYIRNGRPDWPFFALNFYKEYSYPMISVMRDLHEQGKLTPVQDRLFAMTRPREELYDIVADPWETVNLAESPKPEHQQARARLSQQVDAWLEQTGDRNRPLESLDVGMAEVTSRIKRSKPAQLTYIDQVLTQQLNSAGISESYRTYAQTVQALVRTALKSPSAPPSNTNRKGRKRKTAATQETQE